MGKPQIGALCIGVENGRNSYPPYHVAIIEIRGVTFDDLTRWRKINPKNIVDGVYVDSERSLRYHAVVDKNDRYIVPEYGMWLGSYHGAHFGIYERMGKSSGSMYVLSAEQTMFRYAPLHSDPVFYPDGPTPGNIRRALTLTKKSLQMFSNGEGCPFDGIWSVNSNFPSNEWLNYKATDMDGVMHNIIRLPQGETMASQLAGILTTQHNNGMVRASQGAKTATKRIGIRRSSTEVEKYDYTYILEGHSANEAYLPHLYYYNTVSCSPLPVNGFVTYGNYANPEFQAYLWFPELPARISESGKKGELIIGITCKWQRWNPDTTLSDEMKYKTAHAQSPATHGVLFTSKAHVYNATIERIMMPRFQPRTKTGNISCYIMNKNQVNGMVQKLFAPDAYETISRYIWGDGSGNLLGLRWFYGIRANAPVNPKPSKVKLGSIEIDSPVVSHHDGDFVQVHLGSVTVPRTYGDARDMSHVKYQCYIPFQGIVDLDPHTVLGKRLHLIYVVNLTDGSAVVNLVVGTTDDPVKKNGEYTLNNIVFSSTVQYGMDIPLNVQSATNATVRVLGTVASTVASAAAGSVAGVGGAILGGIGGFAGSVNNPVQSTYTVGSLSANANNMASFTPELYLTVFEDVTGDLGAVSGYPCGKVITVGQEQGYLEAGAVYKNTSIPIAHADEITELLRSGVYAR